MARERARFILMEMFEYIVPYLGESTVRDAEGLHFLSIAVGRDAPYHNTDTMFDLACLNARRERMQMFKADHGACYDYDEFSDDD